MARDEEGSESMQKVGFIGLGLMGGPMAANIARAGFPLTVFNRSPEKADPVVQLGAKWVSSPREVAEHSNVVVTMLSDASAVRAVLEGEDGLVAGAGEDMVLIDMSTVSPTESRKTAEFLGTSGIRMLDAPVYGSTGPATDGTLGIMVGGDELVFEAQKSLLGVMGKNIFYMGDQGSGAAVKLCFNLMVAGQVISLAEAMVLAGKSGLDLKQVGEVVTSSGINSNLIERKVDNIVTDNYTPAFPLKHMHKDLGLMVKASIDLDASLPVTGLTHQLYTAARASGFAEDDFAAIFKTLAGLSARGA
jgi:3-hydroxyisobutyrate dehydrogenase-like beta-hydroxyacid dehydrogenase